MLVDFQDEQTTGTEEERNALQKGALLSEQCQCHYMEIPTDMILIMVVDCHQSKTIKVIAGK